MKFSEIVDIDELQRICESFTAMTGAVMAILDLEGTILVATGWKEICTRYHRENTCTARRCQESDTVLASQLKAGEKYNVYKCKNGLVDVAVPIFVEGEHVANFFTGQFLFEPPDVDYFINQAKEFGFDQTAYLNALNQVPIFSESKVKSMMDFFTQFAQLIGNVGLTQKRLEESNVQLLNAKNAAEAANHAKSVFISNMNHELRTPLNAILGFSELMARDNTISEKNRERLQLINSNGWNLLQLIESILDISSIDTERMELNVEAFDLFKFFSRIGEAIKAHIEKKKLNFVLKIDSQVPQYVKSDNAKLEKILLNLLENAVKFTKQGQIKLQVTARLSPTSLAKMLEIEVIDSGIGISEIDLKALFKPFVQLTRTNAGLEGTGLGLAIAKSLVEVMGGKISVNSVFGSGSTFKIELPITLANADEIKTETAIASQSTIDITHNDTATELTVEMLGLLPAELKQQLHHAALLLNIDDLLEQIHQISAELANCLQKLAQNYQFNEIIRLTADEPSHLFC